MIFIALLLSLIVILLLLWLLLRILLFWSLLLLLLPRQIARQSVLAFVSDVSLRKIPCPFRRQIAFGTTLHQVDKGFGVRFARPRQDHVAHATRLAGLYKHLVGPPFALRLGGQQSCHRLEHVSIRDVVGSNSKLFLHLQKGGEGHVERSVLFLGFSGTTGNDRSETKHIGLVVTEVAGRFEIVCSNAMVALEVSRET